VAALSAAVLAAGLVGAAAVMQPVGSPQGTAAVMQTAGSPRGAVVVV